MKHILSKCAIEMGNRTGLEADLIEAGLGERNIIERVKYLAKKRPPFSRQRRNYNNNTY